MSESKYFPLELEIEIRQNQSGFWIEHYKKFIPALLLMFFGVVLILFFIFDILINHKVHLSVLVFSICFITPGFFGAIEVRNYPIYSFVET